jgi:hypothetical protein
MIQVWMIAAARADQLIHVGIAAFEMAVHDTDRLAPQERRAAVAGLTGEGDGVSDVGSGTPPRVTAIMGARSGDGGRTGSRFGAVYGVKVARISHCAHRQAVVPAATWVRSSDAVTIRR